MKTKKYKIGLMLFFVLILCFSYIGMLFVVPKSILAEQPELGDPTTGLEPPPEEEEPDEEENEVVLPADPYKLVNYALDIYNNGKGAESSFSYTISNSAYFMWEQRSATQYVVDSTARCGDKAIEQSWFYYNSDMVTDILAGYGLVKNQYRAIHTDKASDKATFVSTDKSNHLDRTYDLSGPNFKKQELKVKEAIFNFKAIYSLEFPLPINKNTATVVKNNTTNKFYTTITMSYNVDKIPEEIRDYYAANGPLLRVDYSKYNYTFVIEKKTGKLKRIIREENFSSGVIPDVFDVTIHSKASFIQDFTSMDKPVEVKEIKI